jgi:hypothetical protein
MDVDRLVAIREGPQGPGTGVQEMTDRPIISRPTYSGYPPGRPLAVVDPVVPLAVFDFAALGLATGVHRAAR